MLKRWNIELDYVLTFIDLDLKFNRKKALILKEIFKISLRYAESYSLIYLHIRISKIYIISNFFYLWILQKIQK
jgi:hypothetical protein